MREYDEELEGWVIANEEGRTYTGEGNGWEAVNDADAEYALAQLAKAHREIERIQAAANRQVERVLLWQEQNSAAPLEAVAFWEQKLIGYRKRLERDDPDLKATYALPSGVIKRTHGRERIVFEDEHEFCEWALVTRPDLIELKPLKNSIKQNPELQPLTGLKELKTTARRSPTGARSRLVDSKTGEPIPGVTLEVGPTTWSAKPT